MKKVTTKEFIERARAVHGDKYDYSKVDYKYKDVKVCIICPKHGEFWQRPNDHLKGHGCPSCKGEKLSELNTKSWEELIVDFKLIHGDKYTYDKTTYVNAKTKMRMACPIHGDFFMRPYAHLNGQSCPLCAHRGFKYTKEEFIEKARKVHGDKYDYSNVEYKDKDSKVCIICSKHGEFLQTPHNHLNGQGCPNCINSKLENKVKSFLEEKKITYIKQYKDKEILGLQSLDFYLPEYNIGIECQGEQHFTPIDFGGIGFEYANKNFDLNLKRDERKINICKKHGIKLIHYHEFEKYFGTYENEVHNINELETVLIG